MKEDNEITKSLTWGGRPAGVPSKKQVDVLEQLRVLGCDPIAGMARIAVEAEKGTEKLDKNGNVVFVKDYALAGQMYKELAQYVAPKRKAVEVSSQEIKDVSNHMTITIDPT